MKTSGTQLARRAAIMTAILAVLVAGGIYGKRLASPSQAEPVAAAPAVGVVVQTLAEQKVRVWSEFSGRLHAVDSAEIRPEVVGRVTAVLFEDGQSVKGGRPAVRHRHPVVRGGGGPRRGQSRLGRRPTRPSPRSSSTVPPA
ncbi:MAG: hypothetical protein WDO24_06985 [Pseudomonadota bacterium]